MHPSSQTCFPEQTSDLPIPLIDFSSFPVTFPPNETEDKALKQQISENVLSAFSQHGLLYLTNHGISPDLLHKVFSNSENFFSLPLPNKEQVCWTTPKANRGWSAPGREKLALLDSGPSKAGPGDLKESFEIGREGVDGCPNRWPAYLTGTRLSADVEKGESHMPGTDGEFKGTMLEFYQECRDLFARVMKAVALGLGLGETWFDQFLQKGDCTLRLLYYPGSEEQSNIGDDVEETKIEARMRAAAHTDYGAITLLFQDDHPGLQVLSPSGAFVDAPPVPGAVIVNAGDLLARWSNDTIKSTIHRVVATPLASPGAGNANGHGATTQRRSARYSIAFFCNPDFDRWIEAIPGTFDEDKVVGGRPKKHEGIYSGDYLEQRLSATY